MIDKKDYAKQCFDYTISELKKVDYVKLNVLRPYKDLQTKKLLSYFENNDCFLSLKEEMQAEIIKEVHYRICDKFDVPYFNVIFGKYHNLDLHSFINCGLTDYRQNLVINLFTQKAFNQLAKDKRDTVGLNYLDTIIHETRHAIQYNYLIEMVKGNDNVPLLYKFINLDMILSNVVENARIKNFCEQSSDKFYLSGAEIDARIFANNVLISLANNGMFENVNRIKEFANNGNFIACSLENYGNSMALSYVERLKKLINNAQDYIDLSSYDEFKFLTDKNALNQYEKELVEREDKNVDKLIEFYSDKLASLKENQYIKEFTPKLTENINNKNLYAIQSLIEQAKALTDLGFKDLGGFYCSNVKAIKHLGNNSLFIDKIKVLNEENFNELKKSVEEKKKNLANRDNEKM